MPLEKIEITENRAWALWRIEEHETAIPDVIDLFEKVPDSITHLRKRLEWIIGRVLVKIVLEKMGVSFQGVTKDAFGKPSPVGCDYQLALSHSDPYVTVLLDKHRPVGIDLEQPKLKLFKIASRVLDADELMDAGDNLTKHCIYWCAKEALIKVYGKKDLILSENLKISPFSLSHTGDIVGQIIVKDTATVIPLQYSVEQDFVIVLSQ